MGLTRHLRIYGRVQGVGFRDALRREALRHGLAGWVRNRRDGTVESILQGDASAVETVTGWAHQGPPAARVDRVDAQPAQEQFDRPYAGFEMLPSV